MYLEPLYKLSQKSQKLVKMQHMLLVYKKQGVLLRFLILTFALMSLLVFSPLASAAGQIEFKDFKVLGKAPQYQVVTRVEFQLTNYLKNALINGVTLKAHIQIRLGQHRSWWFNKDKQLLTATYQLKYHALSRRYLLIHIDTNEHWNFASLPAALRKLGELRKYQLPKLANIKKDEDYYLLAVADLVPASLRLPLRIQSLFSDEYGLTSEGVFWPLP